MPASAEAIRALVEPSLRRAGTEELELWDVEVSAGTVRVLIDRPGGIDLDSLSTLATRVISPLLDAHPELTPQGSWLLEVSSPGLERNLRRPEQFARYVGAEVSIKTRVPLAGARRFRGRLVAAGPDAVVIAPEDAPQGSTVAIPLDQLERARTVAVWGQPRTPSSKPGQKGRRSVAKRPAPDGPPGAAEPAAITEREAE